MGCGLSALIDRRTHTHSATRAPPGPTRAARFCAGRIVRRTRSSRPPASSRATATRASQGPAPSAGGGILTRKGGAPGRRGGPPAPRVPRGAAAAAGNSRRGPLASGRAGLGCGAGLTRLPAGAGPGLTRGSSLGRSGQGPAAQAWFFLFEPSWARLQPRPTHAPGPVGKGQSRAKASRPDSSPPAPARRAGRPTRQPRGRMSAGGTSPGRTSRGEGE